MKGMVQSEDQKEKQTHFREGRGDPRNRLDLFSVPSECKTGNRARISMQADFGSLQITTFDKQSLEQMG